LNIRILRARELLRRGLPVAEVALETGFYDQAHLTRVFKRCVGVPPRRFSRA
jgi:AraC-like DNA-binding protein